MQKGAKGRTRITAQGQVSVPARVREMLGVHAGSVLEWHAEGDRVTVRRVAKHTSDDVHQSVFGARKPVARTLKELKDGIRRYIRARHARD